MDEINIQYTPVFCTITSELPIEVQEKLYNALAFRPQGYFYSLKYQTGNWDGWNRLYYPQQQRFRSWLLNRVINILKELGYIVNIIGLEIGKPYIQHSNTYNLRQYQLKAVNNICEKRFGIVRAPMRSGKTIIAIGVVDSERKFPVVFFCRSLDLAYQIRDKFHTFLPDISIGLIGDGEVDIKEVTVVTIQSAYSAYEKKCPEKVFQKEKPIKDKFALKQLLHKAKIVFVDECHHSRARTTKFILDKCISANMRIGLSATPFNDVGEDLIVEEVLGPIIYDISYSDLIKEGFLLRPTIYMYKLPPLSVDGNYQSVYKQAVIENDFLSQLIKKIVNNLTEKNKSVVVQTEYINHTKKLGKILGCPTLTGNDKTEYRYDIIKKLNNKEILCVVSTLFEEGLDLPSLDYVINVAGGLSSISTLQRMRSITAIDGKNTCGIIDFYHQCKYLNKHSKKRKNLYESESEFKLFMRDISN